MDCEVCGRQDAKLKAIIEQTEFTVCDNCARFGKVVSGSQQRRVIPKKPVFQREKPAEPVERIIPNYGEIIKLAREKLSLSQEDFAKRINEKISLVHKVETNSYEPPIDIAKKIERFLRVKLVYVVEDSNEKADNVKSGELTIGDVIKNIKTRK